jgi:hypothetical protein
MAFYRLKEFEVVWFYTTLISISGAANKTAGGGV